LNLIKKWNLKRKLKKCEDLINVIEHAIIDSDYAKYGYGRKLRELKPKFEELVQKLKEKKNKIKNEITQYSECSRY